MTEYINKDYYRQIPANERHFIKLSQEAAYAAVKELEAANILHSATISEYRSIVTVNKADSERAEKIAEKTAKAFPSVRTILGNTEFKNIRDRKYIDTDADTARKIADILSGNANNRFSSIIRGNRATITVSGEKNAAAVRSMIENLKNMDLLAALRERGFERVADTNGFVNIRSVQTGEVCGFNSMAAVREMLDNPENEFFYPLSYRIAYREHPTNGDYYYYIQKYNSADRASVKAYRDSDNKPPIFKSVDEALSYTQSNKITVTNIDEEIANWREIDREREDNSIIEENRKLIEKFPASSSGEYIDLIGYDPNTDSFSWVYFNPDGDNGNGEFIDKTITKDDIFAAYSERISAENEEQGRSAFIAYLNEHCKENVIELHSGYFEGYAEDYINYSSRNYAYYFGISENSTAKSSVDSFISHLELNCEAAVKDKEERAEPQEVNERSFRVELEGYAGVWNVIEAAEIDGRELFLLENDYYGDGVAHIVADKDGNVVDDNVWGDFEEYENTLVKRRLIEEAESTEDGITMPVLKEFADDMKNYGFEIGENNCIFTANREDVASFIRMDIIAEIFYDISEKYRFEPNEVGNNHLLDLDRFYDSYEWSDYSVGKNVLENTIIALQSGDFEPIENYIEQVRSVCENSDGSMRYEESKVSEAAEHLEKVKSAFVERNKVEFETEEKFPNGELTGSENIAEEAQESNIHFSYFGNGVLCYDVSRLDKKIDDYLSVAHISNEGNIRYYVDDLSEDDKQAIENHAKAVKDKFSVYWNNLSLQDRYGRLYDSLLSSGTVAQIRAFDADRSVSDMSEKVKKYEHSLIFKDEEFPFENSPAVDFETELGNLTLEKNREAVEKIEVGSEISLNYEAYIIKSIDGDFMMSMDKKGEVNTGMSGKQYIGNWKEQLLNEAGNNPLFVYGADLANELNSINAVNDEISKDNSPADNSGIIPDNTDSINNNVNSLADNMHTQANNDDFEIYQVKRGDKYFFKRFVDLSTLGGSPDISDYDLVYSGKLSEIDINAEDKNVILEKIYLKFNTDHPEDFTGRSLSVSDIVVLHSDGAVTAHYVDDVGFKDVSDFLAEKTREQPHILSEGGRENLQETLQRTAAAQSSSEREKNGEDKFHNSPMETSDKEAKETVKAQKPKKIPNTIAHRNFTKLKELFPEFMEKNHSYEHYESDGYEPLSAEWIGDNEMSLMHTFVQNGDLMYDPDVVLKVDFEKETANAISYENSGIGVYFEYSDGSKGQKDTNSFMTSWLNNIELQSFELTRYDDINGNRIDVKLLNAEKAAAEKFREKTRTNFNDIDGSNSDTIEKMVSEYISEVLSENGIEAEIGEVVLYGSRSRGLENDNSDIDIVVQIKSDLKEDALFNILNESGYTVGGIKVDINPIRSEKTGTLEDYLVNVEEYLKEKSLSALSSDKAYLYSEIKFETGEVYLVPGIITDDNIGETAAYKEILELYADKNNTLNLDDMLRVNIQNYYYGRGEESVPTDEEMKFIRENSVEIINRSEEIGNTEFFAHFWKNVDDVLDELDSKAAEQHKTSQSLGDGYEEHTYIFPSDYFSDYPEYYSAVSQMKIGGVWSDTEEAVKNMNAQGNTDTAQIEALRVRTVSFDGIERNEEMLPEAFHIILDRTINNKDKLKEAAELYEKNNGNIMPVYTKTPSEATEAGEREIYFANRRENERCASSIDYSIGCNHDGAHFDSVKAISDLLNTYALDRIALIIAARVSDAGKWDGRFSRKNIEWAENFIRKYPTEQVTAISRRGLKSHSVLLDAAASELIKNYELFRSMQTEKEKEVNADASEPEQQNFIDSIKNLSQLKRTLTAGTEFVITDHVRKECVGERRRITEANTAGFYSQKINSLGNAESRPLYMEWGKSGNWNFEDGVCTSSLSDKSLVMAFKVLDSSLNIAAESITSDDSVIPSDSSSPMGNSVEERHISAENIAIGDKFLFKGTEVTVSSFKGIYPDDIGVSKIEKSGGIAFEITTNAERMWSSIMEFANRALELFDFEEARTIFENPKSFDISSLGREKTVLFLNVSDTDRTFDNLINVFYTQALQILCSNADKRPDGRLKVPVRIIMDDFAASARIPDFDKIISVIRSRDISVSLVLQSMMQLEAMYTHAEATTIINNCDHIIYLGSQDLQTAEFIGNRIFKTPDTVLCTPRDKAIIITTGEKAVIADKIKPYSTLKT